MGGKRRENYDDWWRCEVRFSPILDELFGITHTKQQVRPTPGLIEVLEPQLAPTARLLNSRVRAVHRALKVVRPQARGPSVVRRTMSPEVLFRGLRTTVDSSPLLLNEAHEGLQEVLRLGGAQVDPKAEHAAAVLLTAASKAAQSLPAADRAALERFERAWSEALSGPSSPV